MGVCLKGIREKKGKSGQTVVAFSFVVTGNWRDSFSRSDFTSNFHSEITWMNNNVGLLR